MEMYLVVTGTVAGSKLSAFGEDALMAALIARYPSQHYTRSMDTCTSRVRRDSRSHGLPRLSLLLAVLTALMLAGHATHLPLLIAGANATAATRPGVTSTWEHGQGDRVSHCESHSHCETKGLLEPAHVPTHGSLCAAGVAADWTRGYAPALALSAVVLYPSAAPRLGLRIRSVPGALIPLTALRRALLQVWRI